MRPGSGVPGSSHHPAAMDLSYRVDSPPHRHPADLELTWSVTLFLPSTLAVCVCVCVCVAKLVITPPLPPLFSVLCFCLLLLVLLCKSMSSFVQCGVLSKVLHLQQQQKTRAHTSTHARTYTHAHAAQIRTQTLACADTKMHTDKDASTHTDMHARTHTRTHARTQRNRYKRPQCISPSTHMNMSGIHSYMLEKRHQERHLL